MSNISIKLLLACLSIPFYVIPNWSITWSCKWYVKVQWNVVSICSILLDSWLCLNGFIYWRCDYVVVIIRKINQESIWRFMSCGFCFPWLICLWLCWIDMSLCRSLCRLLIRFNNCIKEISGRWRCPFKFPFSCLN